MGTRIWLTSDENGKGKKMAKKEPSDAELENMLREALLKEEKDREEARRRNEEIEGR